MCRNFKVSSQSRSYDVSSRSRYRFGTRSSSDWDKACASGVVDSKFDSKLDQINSSEISYFDLKE